MSSAGRLTCAVIQHIDAVSVGFGGVRVWAPNEAVLSQGLEELQIGIDTALTQHSSLDKNGLAFMLAELIGQRVDWKVLGAVLGAELRRGAVEEILCTSLSNKVFRVYIGASVRDRFLGQLNDATGLLRAKKQLKVTELRDRLFGADGGKGTWTQAAHVVAHMVFRGIAIYIDTHVVAWPTGLERAFG